MAIEIVDFPIKNGDFQSLSPKPAAPSAPSVPALASSPVAPEHHG